MINERHKYSLSSLKQIEKPEQCIICGHARIIEVNIADIPRYDVMTTNFLKSFSYCYMCCNCGKVLGIADNRFSPEDVIKAHERPDLSEKYMQLKKA